MATKTAAEFLTALNAFRDETGEFAISMGQLFALAKTFKDMAPNQIRRLLAHTNHKVRVGAVSIMDFQARSKHTSAARRKELFDLYITHHRYIDKWDLVDRAAPYVVGGYLSDKPREVLYKLAKSHAPMERRTAIVATYYFIRQNDLDDTFAIAQILAHDPEDLVQKAVGGWIREAGKKDQNRLAAYLDKYAATMPRTALRYAIEHFSPERRTHYLELKKENNHDK